MGYLFFSLILLAYAFYLQDKKISDLQNEIYAVKDELNSTKDNLTDLRSKAVLRDNSTNPFDDFDIYDPD